MQLGGCVITSSAIHRSVGATERLKIILSSLTTSYIYVNVNCTYVTIARMLLLLSSFIFKN